MCSAQFLNRMDMKRHHFIRNHTGAKPYKCDTCRALFLYRSDLEKHIRTHTGEKPYKCDICGARFQNKSNLKTHIRIHTGEKPFKCDTCGIKFAYRHDLRKHNSIHTGEAPYKCVTCDAKFSRIDTLNVHARTHNTDIRYGGVQFAKSSSLKLRVCISTQEKQLYKCRKCGAEFVTSGMLKRHVGIHTLYKLDKCKTCGARFTNKCHIDVNSGDEPYKCDTCDAKSANICSPETETHGMHNEHMATGFESTVPVCQEIQLEMDEQDSSVPLNNSETETRGALGDRELIEVEQGMKTDHDECFGNNDVATRQWVVFPGDMLTEFKPEHTGALKEAKSEHNGQNLNREVTRSWVVCPGGELKEVKTEHNE